MKYKKWKIILCIFLISVVYIGTICSYIVWDNMRVVTTSYSIYSDKLPTAFDHYKIALITDFHNSSNGDKVIANVKKIEPDAIFMVGDMINMESENYDNFSHLMDALVKIAPTYYTYGNHEIWSNRTDELYYLASKKGVKVLNNDITTLTEEESSINLIAFKDPGADDHCAKKEYIEDNLKQYYAKRKIKNGFTLLLFHRANYFEQVVTSPYDLVLSGHLHDGQINLPIIQKQILRNNVNCDLYTRGLYRKGQCQMVISGGLEFNWKTPRVFNTPEVVDIQLRSIQ